MSKLLLQGVAALALLTPIHAFPASDAEIAELKVMLNEMKAQYEERIQALENRLANAERESARRKAQAAESKPMTAAVVHSAPTEVPAKPSSGFGALTSGTAFNPQISVILDGNYYHDGIDGKGPELVGEAFQASSGGGHSHHSGDEAAHAHGATENGFNFREAEIAFSATVDPYFDAAMYLAVDGDGSVELEEGYFQTRSLPYGLKIKGGKFLSDFGYANKQHPHQWDFVDQNLPYLNLIGYHGLQDTGVQLTWLPDLPIYTLFGVEASQCNQEIFCSTVTDDEREELNLDDPEDGPTLWTGFAKFAPDLGENHALQLGVSYAHNTQYQTVRTHTHAHEGEASAEVGHEEELHENGLAGDADLWGLDVVYKYDGGGDYGKGDFKFQSEYLRSIKDLEIRSSPHEAVIGSKRKFTTDGLYAQATYGFAPRWKAGLRYDVLGLTNKVSGGVNEDYGSSDRWTVDVSWNLSEFSMLRAQYARNDILVSENERERFDAFYLQFVMSMGSHGAHTF